jgi:hypothetical protein
MSTMFFPAHKRRLLDTVRKTALLCGLDLIYIKRRGHEQTTDEVRTLYPDSVYGTR